MKDSVDKFVGGHALIAKYAAIYADDQSFGKSYAGATSLG